MTDASSFDINQRVVFDCNVYLQAVVSDKGPAMACLEFAEAGLFTLISCTEVIRELVAVLARPSIRTKFTSITDERVEAYVARLEKVVEFVEDIPVSFVLPRDRDDELYVNLAITGRAGYIITRDRDLLSLRDEDDEVSRNFRTRFPEMKVLDPVEFLGIVRSSHN